MCAGRVSARFTTSVPLHCLVKADVPCTTSLVDCTGRIQILSNSPTLSRRENLPCDADDSPPAVKNGALLTDARDSARGTNLASAGNDKTIHRITSSERRAT